MNILELNDYCFDHILKYLQIEDHINVSQVCTRFRQVVQLWGTALYPTFYIDEVVNEDFNVNTLRQQLILCGVLSGGIRKLVVNINHADYHFYSSKQACLLDNELSSEVTSQHFLGIYRQKGHAPKELIPIDWFCNLIKSMQSLEMLTISKSSFFYVPDTKIINEMVSAVKHLPNLKSLQIRTKLDINIENLCEANNLEILHLEGVKRVPDLVKYCKSNQNLRALHLHNCKIDGDLHDIVPQCPKLEEISFLMAKDSKGYIQLANLPNLRILNIRSLYYDDMSHLLKAFSDKPLHSLKFIETVAGFKDMQQIIKIATLRHVQATYDDPKSFELLAQLRGLHVLRLSFRGDASVFSAACLKMLHSNRNLKCLQIYSDLGHSFRKEAFALIKSIRNAEKQRPLHLEMPDVLELSQNEVELLDKRYMTFNQLPFNR